MAHHRHASTVCKVILIATSILILSVASFPLPNDSTDKRSPESKPMARAEAPNGPLGGLQGFISGNSSGGTMILGSYQTVLMPMPRGQDIMNGINGGLQLGQVIQSLLQG